MDLCGPQRRAAAPGGHLAMTLPCMHTRLCLAHGMRGHCRAWLQVSSMPQEKKRINKEGELVVTSTLTRSQA